MRYNAVTDHDDVFAVPDMSIDDGPIYIGLMRLGIDYTHDGADRWAYSIGTGPWDADVRYQGEDLWGPAAGTEEAEGMATVLMGFLFAYGEGDLTFGDDGEAELFYDSDVVAVGQAAEFIAAVSERMGIASHDLEEGYLVWSDETRDVNGIQARVAIETGKVPE